MELKVINFKKTTKDQLKEIDFSNEFTQAQYMQYSIANMQGKLAGLTSISTNSIENCNCNRYRNIPGSICESCYVSKETYKTNMFKKLSKNQEFYTTVKINTESIPFLNAKYHRFESHGDLNNTIQVYNYFKITEKNTHCNCALWTKSPIIIDKAMKEFNLSKPENLQIVFSIIMRNASNIPDIEKYCDAMQKRYPFINKFFIVWDSEELCNAAGYKINCGGNSCYQCHTCYDNNNVRIIHEIKK